MSFKARLGYAESISVAEAMQQETIKKEEKEEEEEEEKEGGVS